MVLFYFLNVGRPYGEARRPGERAT